MHIELKKWYLVDELYASLSKPNAAAVHCFSKLIDKYGKNQIEIQFHSSTGSFPQDKLGSLLRGAMKRLVDPTSQRFYRLGDRPTSASTNNAHILFEMRKFTQKQPAFPVSLPITKAKQEVGSKLQPMIAPLGNPSPKYSESLVKQYERSEEIKQYILNLANGICECCEQKAPFVTEDGKPYLEVHHLQPLALDGPDTPENTVAICPNCHRELHSGRDRGLTLQNLCKRVKRVKQPALF